MQIPPHNFSRSPVHEVQCSYQRRESEPVIITIPSPYPGWNVIQDRIGTSLDEEPDDRNIVSCRIKYVDIFALSEGDIPQKLIAIAPCIPRQMISRIHNSPFTELTVQGIRSDSDISVRCELRKNQMVLLFETEYGKNEIMDQNAALSWFDAAREDIHLLFDIMVSDELKKRIS